MCKKYYTTILIPTKPINNTPLPKIFICFHQCNYVSLTIGHIQGEASHVVNVIAYSDLLTVENEHSNVVKSTYVVSTDVTAFSEAIQNIVKAN